LILCTGRPRQTIDWSYDRFWIGIHVWDSGKKKIKAPIKIRAKSHSWKFVFFLLLSFFYLRACKSSARQRDNAVALHIADAILLFRSLGNTLREAINCNDSHRFFVRKHVATINCSKRRNKSLSCRNQSGLLYFENLSDIKTQYCHCENIE